jgi:hypothetical protein
MAAKAIPDDEFVDLYETVGPTELAKRVGVTLRGVFERRRALEGRIGRAIVSPDNRSGRKAIEHPQRVEIMVADGHVLIGSDAHYWPGDPSVAHRAFIHLCKKLKPVAVIMNGDVIDAPTISQHKPIGWEDRPKLIDEINAAKERMKEIEKIIPFATRKIWPLGNHDARFETRLAYTAPEYAEIHGVHLKDHFPNWEPCWSAWINDDIVIKHRFKGGMHAIHNNVLWAGKTMITGHLHSQNVRAFTDYNGTRWGVDGGCLADVHHKAFRDYTEDNPLNWRAGFVVLKFHQGELLPPELVSVRDQESVVFRGEVIRV